MPQSCARTWRKVGVLQLQLNCHDDAAAWLFGVLLADEAGEPADDRAAGATVVSEHAVVPPRGRGRFLVPVGPRTVAASSISAFNGLRPWKTRLVRTSLAGAIRLGVSGPLLRQRVQVTARTDGSDELADLWLVEHLRRVLGEPELIMATGLRPGDTFSKPVLQLFRPDGSPVGYAKVGWNAVTVPRVRTEAAVLDAWPHQHPSTLRVPRLLHAGEWAGRFVAVTAPMPRAARRLGNGGAPATLASAAVFGSAPTHHRELGRSDHWHGLLDDVRRIAGSDARGAATLGRIVDAIGERQLGQTLRFGRWHGDWVSWNLARADGKLWAWDWEYSDPDVPVGFDAIHHLFQEAFVGAHQPMTDAMEAARRGAHELLPALGLTEPQIDLTIALHRAEVLRRDAVAESLGGSPDPRLEHDGVGIGAP